MMRRFLLGVSLGVVLTFAAACAAEPGSDTEVLDSGTGASETGAQGSDPADKPLVTVSRSPT